MSESHVISITLGLISAATLIRAWTAPSRGMRTVSAVLFAQAIFALFDRNLPAYVKAHAFLLSDIFPTTLFSLMALLSYSRKVWLMAIAAAMLLQIGGHFVYIAGHPEDAASRDLYLAFLNLLFFLQLVFVWGGVLQRGSGKPETAGPTVRKRRHALG